MVTKYGSVPRYCLYKGIGLAFAAMLGRQINLAAPTAFHVLSVKATSHLGQAANSSRPIRGKRSDIYLAPFPFMISIACER